MLRYIFILLLCVSFVVADDTFSTEIVLSEDILYHIHPKDRDIPIEEIKFEATANSTAALRISIIDKPRDTFSPGDEVLEYLQIDAQNLSAHRYEITFFVRRSWLEDHNVEEENFFLYHLTDEWNVVGTKRLNRSSKYVYYDAITTDLGSFALAGEESEIIERSAAPTRQHAVIQEDPKPKITPPQIRSAGSSQDDRGPFMIFLLVVLAFILFVLLALLFRKSKKSHHLTDLIAHVRSEKKRGVQHSHLIAELRKARWSEAHIKEALEKAKK